jgi:RIO-like serine/threonine protein kinase
MDIPCDGAMTTLFASLKLSDLPQRKVAVLREPSSTRPTLWVVEEDGVRAVIKDYRSNRFIYRNTIGRFLVWRENKAYRRLRGLKGIPTFYRVIDGLALVVEEISGRSLEGVEKETRLSGEFFTALRDLVESVHKRGLAHCDLKRAPNVLIGHDGRPYIVDWSASISQRELRFFPLKLIYQRFVLDDLNGIIKIQLRHHHESISPEEKSRYYQRNRAEKFVRVIRDIIRDFLQRIA